MTAAALVDLDRAKAAAQKPAEPDRKAAIAHARQRLAPSLRDREAPVYPVAALGPLAEACADISQHGQVQPAMAGQCLLGAASLMTQGLHNVEDLKGSKLPMSLNLGTLGDSGDGKSTAQSPALRPVMELQRKQAEQYREDMAEFEANRRRKKGDRAEQGEPPACPFRLVGDATVEGLRRDLDGGVCSQGLFSDEAAAIVSGYGMSADHRAKTAGVFNKLWDSGYLSVSRATSGRVERYGRRFAQHWLIQPMAAAEAFGDPMLAALGFWPRFLLAWPAPQEPRKAQPFRPDQIASVGRYWQRCSELLEVPLPEDVDGQPVIGLSADARALLARAFERFEVEARRGELRVVKPFAIRASEQACRVAGVLAAFAGDAEVDRDTMAGALALVSYSLQTWKAVVDEGAADQRGTSALRLFEWLTTRPNWSESLATIVNGGPACVRSKDKRDAALSVLEAAELVAIANGRAIAMEAPQ